MENVTFYSERVIKANMVISGKNGIAKIEKAEWAENPIERVEFNTDHEFVVIDGDGVSDDTVGVSAVSDGVLETILDNVGETRIKEDNWRVTRAIVYGRELEVIDKKRTFEEFVARWLTILDDDILHVEHYHETGYSQGDVYHALAIIRKTDLASKYGYTKEYVTENADELVAHELEIYKAMNEEFYAWMYGDIYKIQEEEGGHYTCCGENDVINTLESIGGTLDNDTKKKVRDGLVNLH